MSSVQVSASPLAGVDLDSLGEAAAAFIEDVLPRAPDEQGWQQLTASGWRSTKKTKLLESDSGTEADLRYDAMLRHLAGLWTLGARPLHNAVVIDVDLPVATKLSEALRCEKEGAAAAVSVVLERFGIPHLHFDSRRGSHTWIRCDSEPTPEAVGALERLLKEQPSLNGRIELRPKGRLTIRLPLGVSHGIGRGPLTQEMPQSELLHWLADPLRATATQLAEVVALAPAPPPRRAPQLREHVGPQVGTDYGDWLRGDEKRAETIAAPYQIRGWENWPVCKQAKYVAGLEREGERHWTYLMIAAEAVLHADLSEEELIELQLRLPLCGWSTSSEAELELDATHNAQAVLARKAAGTAVRTGCPARIGAAGDSPLRRTFEDGCTEARFALCPVGAAVWPLRTPYARTLESSIWRKLGLPARAVYEMAIGRAQGMPGARVQLSSRYIVVKRPYLSKGAADTALMRLREEGLLFQEKSQSGIYTLSPPPDPVALAELEDRLGTAVAHQKDATRARAMWGQARVEKREFARIKEIEAQSTDREGETEQ